MLREYTNRNLQICNQNIMLKVLHRYQYCQLIQENHHCSGKKEKVVGVSNSN